MSQCRVRSPYEITFRTACSEIAILDHSQNDILQRLANVRAWKQQKLLQFTHLVHTNTPISRLPNEILAFIFESMPQHAVAISHVNRHWRQVALRLPFLWKHIHLSLHSDQIVEYLNRSQPLNLAITFDVNDDNFRGEDHPDEGFDEEDPDAVPSKVPNEVMTRLTMLIDNVSRWHSFHVDCTSPETMFTILGYLGGLSAPHLTHVSVQIHKDGYDDFTVDWHVAIFSGSAPLLCTVHLCGITLSHCHFPLAAITELEVNVMDLDFDHMDPKMLAYIPNLRVLDIRGIFPSWIFRMKTPPVSLPKLERLTWGCIASCLFEFFVTPVLRYLCLTSSLPDGIYDDMELQDFSDAITKSSRIPVLPNLEELRYDIKSNYAANCIFDGLPRVSLVQFPHLNSGYSDNWQLCGHFFKNLMDNSSRWPHLKTVVFRGLPDQLFDAVRDFVLARSSEDHRFTIRIECDPVIHYFNDDYRTLALSTEHMVWLQQHANVERVHCETSGSV
ncbi:hypothetical protein PILCRDRAFT_5181 [Piloderma croceum F 1598]|uniref:F-box domain-containing protein n=1 Tax=Piloderma croceum (strain F 1598) TaxID=765440 RepID=A0A0C3FPS6_PILCF|nr:hypothetical protein PILCRDRAFT_5181 [Piloderma croceum F 1598]